MYYEQFAGPITIESLPDPKPIASGVVIKLEASGLCRSDWHGWMGHDTDIKLPHVPGHELAGTIIEIGKEVKKFKVGDRVTVPFVGGCGSCIQCHSGNHQICDHQFQPGFTHWGSFAEYVAIQYADINIVRLPDDISFETAASLGCRFITSYRGIVHQAKVNNSDWVVIHGCGGIGLSAIMIAASRGAQVIAVDIDPDKLNLAKELGASIGINSLHESPIDHIKELSAGGAHISVDALGSQETCQNSISCLRKRGRHIQIGLMTGIDYMPQIPMHLVVANELEIIGSHGMQAHCYPQMLAEIKNKTLKPELLIGQYLSLDEAKDYLPRMNEFQGIGIRIINRF